MFLIFFLVCFSDFFSWCEQEYWEHAYEDILDVIAKMPEVAALIYRCKFKDGKVKKDLSLDYTGNYCSMMGYDDKNFQDLMRLYLVIHSVRAAAYNHTAHAERNASVCTRAQAVRSERALCREFRDNRADFGASGR